MAFDMYIVHGCDENRMGIGRYFYWLQNNSSIYKLLTSYCIFVAYNFLIMTTALYDIDHSSGNLFDMQTNCKCCPHLRGNCRKALLKLLNCKLVFPDWSSHLLCYLNFSMLLLNFYLYRGGNYCKILWAVPLMKYLKVYSTQVLYCVSSIKLRDSQATV